MIIMTKKRGRYAKPTEGKRKERMVTVRMPSELHAILCEVSDDNNKSLNAICIDALYEHDPVRILTTLKNQSRNTNAN